jgi:hypothetical protein
MNHPYQARCALCPWRSEVVEGDDAAFDALAAHGDRCHGTVQFPGGELIPLTLAATKISLYGPRPFGGSYHTLLTDPNLDKLIGNGWTVTRTWQVWERDDRTRFTVEISDGQPTHAGAVVS